MTSPAGLATELKPVRRALLRELDSYFTQLPVGTLLAKGDGEILLVSETLARMLGRSSAQSPIGASFLDLCPIEQRPELEKMLAMTQAEGRQTWESDLVRRDGTRFHARLDAFAVKDELGKTRAMVLHVQDLTRELEAAKRHVELDTLRAVVNNLPVVLFHVDRNGTFLLSEGGGLGALGLEPGQVVGTSAFELYRGVPWIRNSLERALAGEPVTGTGPVGDLFFEATHLPTRDRKGVTTGVLGLALDVTKRTRSEQEKEQLIQQLHEALHLRDEFLSIASHELRTPLSTLSLKIELLRHRALAAGPMMASEQVISQVEQLMRLTKRMARLVDGLLDVSRIATGRLTLEFEELDLAEVTIDVTERMRAQFERAGNALVVRAAEPAIGYWDRTRLEQVLENLLSNALKHGGGRVEVTVKVDPMRATLSVRDHGSGIPIDQRERIFERFVRAAPNGLGGLGLGLYISRQIIEAHGGNVWVESEPDKGTTFFVTLPWEPEVKP
jgi:PAS domain S-box-containing protein